MFENPPAWTEPIANLTGWFDWQAIGAIGTMLAVWVALWQSGRAERSALVKQMVRLRSLTFSFYGLLSVFDKFLQLPPPVGPGARGLLSSGFVQSAREDVERLAAGDMPDSVFWLNVVTARGLVLDLLALIEEARDANQLSDVMKGSFERAVEELRVVAKRLVRATLLMGEGPLGRLRLRAVFALEDAGVRPSPFNHRRPPAGTSAT